MVPADLSLVRDASQTTRPWKNAEQRELREADRGRTVVDQNDFVASQSKLVTSSSGSSVAGSNEF
jgi:hypothetical protein